MDVHTSTMLGWTSFSLMVVKELSLLFYDLDYVHLVYSLVFIYPYDIIIQVNSITSTVSYSNNGAPITTQVW